MEEKENKKVGWKDLTKKTKVIIILTAIILIACIAVLIVTLNAEPEGITTITKSSLKEIAEDGKLTSIQYIYNSTICVKDDKDNAKYYVAYCGTVRAGFDFQDIQITQEDKKIVITIPEVNVLSTEISEDMDYIFVKDKYNTETTYQEAYNKSCQDLEDKAKANTSLLEKARENAVEVMKAFVKPLEDQLEEGYTIEVR